MQQHRWDNLTPLTSYPPYRTHAVCKWSVDATSARWQLLCSSTP